MKLFTTGRLSSGYAASLLGITRRDFLERLQKQGLPCVQYTEEDLAKDLETLAVARAQRSEAGATPPSPLGADGAEQGAVAV
jgi:hypothetical protein